MIKEISIKDLYVGRPDAKDEINFDGVDNFLKTYILPPNFSEELFFNNNNCFINGYKGTGKTALLFYLSDYKIRKDPSSCLSFIFFKEEFTDLKKTTIEEHSKNILSSVAINNETLIDNNDFEYIWRWIFLKKIISDNEIHNNGLFIEDEQWYKFKTLMDKIIDPNDVRKVRINSMIKLSVPYFDPSTGIIISPELEVDFRKSKTDYAYENFICLIDQAEQAFTQLNKTDIPYIIFIDELEAYYGDEAVFKKIYT